jgi:UDP:flavonoid glycosyltransferase YjiC (YdhE family)
MIVPHIIDQYMWSEKVSQLGAGPKGVAIDKINMNNLEGKITDLWNNQSYKYKSGKISEAMKNEDLQDTLYQFLVNVKNN